VHIGRHSYIDGGVHSPTNAAILRGAGLDLVVIVSPMSGATRLRLDFQVAARRYAERLLSREVKALSQRGIRTVVFAPGDAEQAVMGNDMMSRVRLDEVIQQSFMRAGEYAARPEVTELMREAADAGP
jgi:NTE family protein